MHNDDVDEDDGSTEKAIRVVAEREPLTVLEDTLIHSSSGARPFSTESLSPLKSPRNGSSSHLALNSSPRIWATPPLQRPRRRRRRRWLATRARAHSWAYPANQCLNIHGVVLTFIKTSAISIDYFETSGEKLVQYVKF